MPKLDDLMENAGAASNYGYSRTKIENLGASEYTLISIARDASGSVYGFERDIDKALGTVIDKLSNDARADYMMVRVIDFDNQVKEIHGFVEIGNLTPSQYVGTLTPGGSTALRDAASNAVSAALDYAKDLKDADYTVNALVIIISDGCDNTSLSTEAEVRSQLKRAMTSESLDSILTILVGVNAGTYSNELQQFAKNVGVDEYREINDIEALAIFVAEASSSSSQALGTGGPSKAIPSTGLTF